MRFPLVCERICGIASSPRLGRNWGTPMLKLGWMSAALATVASAAAIAAPNEHTFTATGFISAEIRAFPQDPEWIGQDDSKFGLSTFAEVELALAWDGGKQKITVTPFGRLDSNDDERTHFDLREASYTYRGEGFDVVFGVHQVFWGRTESRHLVNVVNQVDFVENFDGDEYLGQPMLNVNMFGDWGKVGLFVMTGFRERTFPGADGRFRGPLPIDVDHAVYESSSEEWHVDFAARYEKSFGPLDFGASYFYGTNREPGFIQVVTPNGPVFRPFYEIMNQAGLDASYAIGNLVLKGEAIYRWGQGDPFFATTFGGEYTFKDAFENADIGVLLEYSFDDRDGVANGGASFNALFDRDVFAGIRLSLKDESDTQVLAGALVDTDNGSSYLYIESSTRIADDWRVGVEARILTGEDNNDPLSLVDRDSYLQVRATKYFSL